MQLQINDSVESLLEAYVLPVFLSPIGGVVWHGDSQFGTEDVVYYFEVDGKAYILVKQPRRTLGDGVLADMLVGNAVAPHQNVIAVHPKNHPHGYLTLMPEEGATPRQLQGDFSLFEITAQ